MNKLLHVTFKILYLMSDVRHKCWHKISILRGITNNKFKCQKLETDD